MRWAGHIWPPKCAGLPHSDCLASSHTQWPSSLLGWWQTGRRANWVCCDAFWHEWSAFLGASVFVLPPKHELQSTEHAETLENTGDVNFHKKETLSHPKDVIWMSSCIPDKTVLFRLYRCCVQGTHCDQWAETYWGGCPCLCLLVQLQETRRVKQMLWVAPCSPRNAVSVNMQHTCSAPALRRKPAFAKGGNCFGKVLCKCI